MGFQAAQRGLNKILSGDEWTENCALINPTTPNFTTDSSASLTWIRIENLNRSENLLPTHRSQVKKILDPSPIPILGIVSNRNSI